MRFGALIVAAYVAVNPFGWDIAGPLRFALVSTIGFASVAASLGSGDSRPKPLPRWSVLGWTFLLVGMVVSTAASVDRWHALIGTPDRHFGLATWVLLVGLFAVASMYPNSIVPAVTRALMFGGAVAGLWAILEVADVGWFASDFAGDRAGGPFRQPAYLAYGAVLAVPVSAGALAAPTRLGRVAAGVALVLSTAGLGLSQSRGAWVAVIAITAAVVLRRRLVVPGLIAAMTLGLLIAFTPVGERIGTLTDDGGVVAGRLDEWRVGVRALTDTPTFGVTGHGPEGYRIVFGQHVDDQYVIDYGRDVFTDRAHNSILDIALSGGLISGLGAVLLYGGLAVTAFQRLRADAWIDVGLAAAVLAGVLQQMVLFPLAELDPVLWVLAGLVVARRPGETGQPPLFRSVSGSTRAVMFGFGLLAILAAVGGLSDVVADRALQRAVERDDGTRALTDADVARDRRPDSIRYDFVASRLATRAGAGVDNAIEEALERLDNGLDVSPRDPALRLERALLLLGAARQVGTSNALDDARDELEDLTADEPRHPQLLLNLGIARALTSDGPGAIEAFTRAAQLDPDNPEPLINLVVVHLEAGDLQEGEAVLDEVDAVAPSNVQAENLRREFLSE